MKRSAGALQNPQMFSVMRRSGMMKLMCKNECHSVPFLLWPRVGESAENS
jgi:hypothetical protein